MIRTQIHPSPGDAAAAAARIIGRHIVDRVADDQPVRLGLATGGTPLPVYRQLIADRGITPMAWSSIATFNLDEYVGLAADHPQSYHVYMNTHLMDHVAVDRARVHLPDGAAAHPSAEAVRYEDCLRESGGITLQLLGIGQNGHIGFNEPGSAADSVTRIVDLAPQTIADNARYFASAGDVPRRAITMGIATILRARQIILLATGENKADAVASAVGGPVDNGNPASHLQNHPDVWFILDEAAAARLSEPRPLHHTR